jgi:hypothetical protein
MCVNVFFCYLEVPHKILTALEHVQDPSPPSLPPSDLLEGKVQLTDRTARGTKHTEQTEGHDTEDVLEDVRFLQGRVKRDSCS